MTTQLRLLDGGQPTPWVLDARTRRIGRRGVAEARQALERAIARQAERDEPRKAG
jgi:hypothetical protein